MIARLIWSRGKYYLRMEPSKKTTHLSVIIAYD